MARRGLSSGGVAPSRLLLVIGKLGRAGAEHQLSTLATGLAGRGHEVTLTVITTASVELDAERRAGVQVVELGAPRGPARARALPALARLARRADLVHCTLWDASLWARLAAIAARRPAVVTDHSTDRRGQTSATGRSPARWIALHNRVLDPFTAATVACARAQLPLLASEGVAPRKTVHIPNGAHVAAIAEAARSGVTREDLGVPADALAVAHVARFRELKNQRATYEAVAALRPTLGDVHALFVGDGPGRDELAARARDDGADWAHFLGRRADVPRIVSLSDLVVLPSLAEAMPMSIVEAMAVGVPVVGTDVGDVGAVLREADAGLVVPASDDEAFQRACARVLGDPDLRARLAANARAASAGYDAAAMVDRYEELFEAVIARRAR